MKKLLILLLVILVTGFGYSQQYTYDIFGYVSRVENNTIVPVPNQQVLISIDSTNTGYSYLNTVLTDEYGFYQDLVTPPGNVSFGFVQTSTYDTCLGSYQYIQQFIAPGVSLTSMDFYLCGPVWSGCENYFNWFPNDPTGSVITFEGYLVNGQQADSYDWDFGDGTTGSGQMVTHTYEIPPNGNAIFIVSLTTTVIDSAGTACTSISQQEVWLYTQPDCFAYFFYYPDSMNVQTIFFQDMSYTANGTMPDSWYWDFGDGNTSTFQNPVHTYADTGYYYVCLTIADSAGNCTNTYCEEIYTGIIWPPLGCESYIMPYGQYGLTVDFQGWTSSLYPTEYTWEFGDGVTATGQFVSHTYSNPGIYMVSLYTVDETGCEWQSWMEVWVDTLYQGCSNYFYYEQTDSTTFTFTGQAYLNNGTTTDDVYYSWDFGDGTYGTGQTVTHYFQPDPAGIYTVCLNTIMMMPDGDSCFATSCQDIYLVPPAFSIFGHIYLENNQVADVAEVHLMTLDTLWQNVIEVETVTIDSGGFYSFQNIPMYNSRLYFVQAELTETSAFFGDYLPTYAISALNWESAMPILPLNNWPADIFMIPGTTLNTGNGTITGNVNNLGTRGMMEDIEIVLMDSGMNPHFYVRSDEQGNFIFDNLPYGTYIIHAEIMGIHTNQASVTLTEGQPLVNVEIQVVAGEANVVFGVNEKKIALNSVGEIYPNPVSSSSRVEISVKEPVAVEFSIYNQLGQMVMTRADMLSSGTSTVSVNSSGLQPGLYLLRVTTEQGDLVTRRFVKSR